MTNDSIGTTGFQPGAAADERLFDSWFDPIEHAVRDRVRSFIEELIEGELASVLARPVAPGRAGQYCLGAKKPAASSAADLAHAARGGRLCMPQR